MLPVGSCGGMRSQVGDAELGVFSKEVRGQGYTEPPCRSSAHLRVCLLIPTFNEVNNIETLLRKLREIPEIRWIVIVDDNSSDGTKETLRQLRTVDSRIVLYSRRGRKGLGTALQEGMQFCVANFEFDRLVQMDADLSHDPSFVRILINSQCDLTIGSRYVDGGHVRGWNFKRLLMSRSANFFARIALGIDVRDFTSGYRSLGPRLARLVASEANCGGYEFQVETILLASTYGFKVEEKPITFYERRLGQSKLASFDEIRRLLGFLLKNNILVRAIRGQPAQQASRG